MSGEQPFLHLFESLGRLPQSHSDAINREAYQALLEVLSVPLDHPGRCVLLRAPRAGHGKTHLLSRIQHHLAPGHEFIPLHPASGCRIDAPSVVDDALRRLGRPLPAAGGLCGLDLIVRRLYSLALQPLVSSGEVPCIDRDGALASLRNRPLETFDFHHPGAVTAHWIRDNFEVLGPRLALELSNLTGIAPRAVGFWVDSLFHFAVTPVDIPGRVDALAVTVFSSGSGDGVTMERLSALLALLSLLMRVVLVADDLEGFSADETAALRLAAFIGSLRHTAERLDVVLSLNRDIWESAFIPRLSGGLADRLSEVVVELEPLTDDQIVALLESRVPGLGMRVLDYMRDDNLESHARGVLRAAAAAWTRASRQPAGTPPPAPRITPPPAMVDTPAPTPMNAAVTAALAAFSDEPAAPPAPTPPAAPEPQPPVPLAAPTAAPASAGSPFQAVAEPAVEATAPPPPPSPPAVVEAQAATPVAPASFQFTPGFSPPPAWQAPAIHETPSPVVETGDAPPVESGALASLQSGFFQSPAVWDAPATPEIAPPAPDTLLSPSEPAVPPSFSTATVFQPPSGWPTTSADSVVQAPAVPEPPPQAVEPEPAEVPATPPAWQAPPRHDLAAPTAPAGVFEAVAPPPAPAGIPQQVYTTSPAWQPADSAPMPEPQAVSPSGPLFEAPSVPPTPEPVQPAGDSAPTFQAPPAWQPSAPTPVSPTVPPFTQDAEPVPTAQPGSDATPVFQSPPVWPTPAFQSAPQAETPPASPTTPPMWHAPAAAESHPVIYATPVGTQTPPAWHEATAPSAPFGQPVPPSQAHSSSPAPKPAPAPETPTPIDQDRVEDLLRQFRERYSRPNP